MKHLTVVFDKLRAAGLTVKQRKFTFREANCVYLGYVVGSRKVQPMEGKVAAIRAFERSQTKKEVRSFLGCVGIIGNLSTTSPP